MAEEEHADGGISAWVIIGVVAVAVIVFGLSKPFDPTFLNIEWLFSRIYDIAHGFLFDYETGLWLKVILTGVCVLLVILIIFLILRLFEMESEHEDHVYPHDDDHTTHEHPVASHSEKELAPGITWHDTPGEAALHFQELENQIPEKPGQLKWETVLDHISSQAQSDWRMAIIEADTILDAMLEGQGYEGANIGERLRSAGQGAFRTYQDAWDAHIVRNKIAHEGADFQLSYREAKQTIDRFENVFREFEYI